MRVVVSHAWPSSIVVTNWPSFCAEVVAQVETAPR